TPATLSKMATAPSRTRSDRSTSTVKSTWPGVSMMLTRYFLSKRSQLAVVAALVMVMPRSRSCSIQSMVAVPSSTDPILGHTRVIQDALGRCGLAGIDVRHDPDIAGILEFE